MRFDRKLSCVEVYDEDWNHLCTAGLKGKVNAAARILGTEDDQKLLELSLEMRKHAEKMAGAKAMDLLQGEILPGYQANLERIGLVGEAKATLPMAPTPKALPASEMTDDDGPSDDRA